MVEAATDAASVYTRTAAGDHVCLLVKDQVRGGIEEVFIFVDDFFCL